MRKSHYKSMSEKKKEKHSLRVMEQMIMWLSPYGCLEHSLQPWALPLEFLVCAKSVLTCFSQCSEVSAVCNSNSKCDIRKVIPYLEVLI